MSSPEAVIDFALGAYALMVAGLLGSFINLAADRLPRGESIVRPRSHCRACGRVLNVIDLLPVLGFVARRGRCATCRAPIGITSPLVEGACVAVMGAALLSGGGVRGVALGFVAVALIGGGWVLANLARSQLRRESRSG